MLPRARTTAAARIAAALVAVALSGALRVVALEAPGEEHRCECRAHAADHRECECALCRKASLAARVREGNLPPCHRAAARDALARTRASGFDGASACVRGTCGGRDHAAATIAGVEPFYLPAGPALNVPYAEEARPPSPARPHERSADPETPPPRPA